MCMVKDIFFFSSLPRLPPGVYFIYTYEHDKTTITYKQVKHKHSRSNLYPLLAQYTYSSTATRNRLRRVNIFILTSTSATSHHIRPHQNYNNALKKRLSNRKLVWSKAELNDQCPLFTLPDHVVFVGIAKTLPNSYQIVQPFLD